MHKHDGRFACVCRRAAVKSWPNTVSPSPDLKLTDVGVTSAEVG